MNLSEKMDCLLIEQELQTEELERLLENQFLSQLGGIAGTAAGYAAAGKIPGLGMPGSMLVGSIGGMIGGQGIDMAKQAYQHLTSPEAVKEAMDKTSVDLKYALKEVPRDSKKIAKLQNKMKILQKKLQIRTEKQRIKQYYQYQKQMQQNQQQ